MDFRGPVSIISFNLEWLLVFALCLMTLTFLRHADPSSCRVSPVMGASVSSR